jgi:hypothetical protein
MADAIAVALKNNERALVTLSAVDQTGVPFDTWPDGVSVTWTSDDEATLQWSGNGVSAPNQQYIRGAGVGTAVGHATVTKSDGTTLPGLDFNLAVGHSDLGGATATLGAPEADPEG